MTNTDRIRLTVVICTWNRAESLRQTLEQFTAIHVPADVDWELLVVNNCCTDDTDRIVHGFCDSLPIRLLHEPQAGLSYARNLAIRQATGSHIAWTDDDVLVDPGWLVALVNAFARFDAAWVFGRSEPKWPAGEPSWYSSRFPGHFALLDYGSEPFVVSDRDHPFYGINFAGTKDAHCRLNGFRAEFGVRGLGGGVGEDIDMFERAFSAGMRIVYTPDALVRHMIPAARTTKQYYRNRYWVSNEVVFHYLPEIYPNLPRLLGLPRFLFRKALDDLLRYARAALTRERSEAFYYELQLVCFARFALEAARHGFRAPRCHHSPAATPNNS